MRRSVPALVLASASPRRAELLRQAGFSFEVVLPGEEEETRGVQVAPGGGDVLREIEELRERARSAALAKAVSASRSRPDAVVVAADTLVAVDGMLLGKPASQEEAAEMLRRLSGRAHHVVTGVAVVVARRGLMVADDSTTVVRFRELRGEEILRYVATGEPMDKAGAYGIQGRAAVFVERLEGDYFGVVGLPLALLARMLEEAGVQSA